MNDGPLHLSPDRVPKPVREVLERLAANGHPSVLVGGCVRDLLEGRTVHDFDAATPAAPERVLELLPCAVPTGLRHGTVMVPTPAGPVDVTRFRTGPRLFDDLAHRDFTVNAVAWDPETGTIFDPHDGLADLRAGRLRAVGSAAERLAEDPLRALRAARLRAERALEPDAELRAAMTELGARVGTVAAERLRSELERILMAPLAGEGLRLLRETGLEAVLAPGLDARAPARVDALPPVREERLAGWLLGSHARAILARLRFGHAVGHRVERLLREHPVQAGVDPASAASVRRLLHRVEPLDLDTLFRLAVVAGHDGAPPAPPELARRAARRAAVARELDAESRALGREDLALDGREVMEVLGCGPGREIGEALRYLTELVLEDPALNDPETLRARLSGWSGGRT